MSAIRRIGWVVLAFALVGMVAYLGYVAYEASRQAVSVDEHRSRDCRTPLEIAGLEYEAINYPIEDDDALRAANPDMGRCTSQGVTAGQDVVTSDGLPIAGWYIPAANGAGPTAPTIVLVHGYGGNKSGILGYGLSLHEAFNLVAFDQRNGGRSGGSQTTLGLLEQNDVRAIVDWLVRTKHPTEIGLFGNSMGASAAINEARHDERIRAIALDSMHTRIVYQFEQRLRHNGHPAYPGTWAIFLGTWARTGLDFGAADPEDAVPDIIDRPVLLTHGTVDDEDLPERTRAFFEIAKAAGMDVELHWCEGAGHGQVDDVCPDDLAAWEVTFFTRTLLGDT